MGAQVAKWGHSLAVRIPKAVAERANLQEGDALDMTVAEDGALVIRAAQRRPALEQLLAGVTPENVHDETDWGAPAGRETW
jgi:antitoxin MazE